ncbi:MULTISPECIES: hypothetical protein [Pseudomonas]|uniref:Uncharacterized protein n=1 Tax=Pseudomonas salomonii TaxID=191391 RepID=A0ABS9GWK4_9PSED|nr:MULTISPECIES: hypothetical protein [Pseudomonas]MCF5548852.1 hypothetical protein [Pseudomonas salomonii]WLH82520.1 hypothetical protein PSH96_16905 [Pseudomonas sp. FP2338]
MITTYKEKYGNGELRLGWASWDDGSMTRRSVKYAYTDSLGKVSRGSPEIPMEFLVDILEFALTQNEVSFGRGNKSPAVLQTCSGEELLEEFKGLKAALMQLQKLMMDMPWVSFQAPYDQIGGRYELVKNEIHKRRG